MLYYYFKYIIQRKTIMAERLNSQNENQSITRRQFFGFMSEVATVVGALRGGQFLYHSVQGADTLTKKETFQKQDKEDLALSAERQLDNYDNKLVKDAEEMTVWLMSGFVFRLISHFSPKK